MINLIGVIHFRESYWDCTSLGAIRKDCLPQRQEAPHPVRTSYVGATESRLRLKEGTRQGGECIKKKKTKS
jgi:hypothetical protein